jgi:hypothetical protein
LKRLLELERGFWSHQHPPPLAPGQILAAADAHRRRTGQWPNSGSGRSKELNGSTWGSIHTALKRGQRGLPGGSSLREFLAKHRSGAR